MIFYIKKHKIIFGLLIIVLIIGGYYGYRKYKANSVPPRFVLAAAENSTIITAVSGSGQVSAVNQVDVKAKVSGDLLSLNAQVGQEVKAGTVLARLDSRDAQKTVRDAQVSLDSAQLALDKLKRGPRTEELAGSQAQIDSAKKGLATAQQDLVDAQDKANLDLQNTYDDALSAIADISNKVDDLLNRQLNDLFANSSSDNTKLSFLTSDFQAESDIHSQKPAAIIAAQKIKDLSAKAKQNPEATLTAVGDQLQIIQTFLARLNDAVNAGITSSNLSAATLSGYKNTVSSARTSVTTLINNIDTEKRAIASQKTTNQNNLTAAQNKISDAQDAIVSAQDALALKTISPDPLDLKTQELSLTQKASALSEAKSQLADYTITAPFDGVIAATSVKVGDPLSSAAVIATLMTKQKTADISLNEVDAAKIKLGQKSTLTFDAVSGLSITGEVAQVDIIGTVSQGVVTYNVKIVFDTQDDRVKPGMSVSADIITDSRTDVLSVPNAAIKSGAGGYYVQMPDENISGDASSSAGVILKNPLKEQTVEIGLANDTNTEITAGLKAGDYVVIRTISGATTATSAASSNSLLRVPGATGGAANRSTGGAAFGR